MSRPVKTGRAAEGDDLNNLRKGRQRAVQNMRRVPSVRERVLHHFSCLITILASEQGEFVPDLEQIQKEAELLPMAEVAAILSGKKSKASKIASKTASKTAKAAKVKRAA